MNSERILGQVIDENPLDITNSADDENELLLDITKTPSTMRSYLSDHIYSRPTLARRIARRGGGSNLGGFIGRGKDIFIQ